MIAHAESHECAPVIEVDADPIPAACFGCHRCARPLVVEPGSAADVRAVAVDCHAARDGELRLAVVIAGVVDALAFSGKTSLALQEGGLPGREAKLELEIARGDRRDVAVSEELERPRVNPYGGSVLGRVGEPEACARCALIVAELAVARVG